MELGVLDISAHYSPNKLKAKENESVTCSLNVLSSDCCQVKAFAVLSEVCTESSQSFI